MNQPLEAVEAAQAPLPLLDLRRGRLETVQINLGDLCNLACTHCHIGASPGGRKNMSRETAERVVDTLLGLPIDKVELTGGAPEMNPSLPMIVQRLSEHGVRVLVRTNLTVLRLPEYRHLAELFRHHRVELAASLPAVVRDKTDRQRGRGTFDESLEALRELNELGYGSKLPLDLVYNPDGPYLPPSPLELEREYRRVLASSYGIRFSRLITMVNAPIRRFRSQLKRRGQLEGYLSLLEEQFNPATVEGLMCRRLLTVDYAGHVYDCDFNLALGVRIAGYEDRRFWEIDFDRFDPPVAVGPHCFACTADCGSSCHGALTSEAVTFDATKNAQEYYGEVISRTEDLRTSACCVLDEVPAHVRRTLPLISDEIRSRFYGCGSPIPLKLDGLRVLDLGCGTGRDVYVLSKLVGERGWVTGLDLTRQQLEIARRYRREHAERFGYRRSNVRFIEDAIENAGAHFEDGSVDLVVSNCVLNLLEDKAPVFEQIHRILAPGGELYFSDVYADRRLPADLRRQPVLHGECLGGALYVNDFLRMARRAGFVDPREVSRREIGITDPEILSLVGPAIFYSITYRLWKLEGLEDRCEDYGHVAVYEGGIEDAPVRFVLDDGHTFELGRPERVCGNTALMLSATRLATHFSVMGGFERHFGEFPDCGGQGSGRAPAKAPGGCC